MSWKRLGNAWLNKNKKANPQNNLPMFTADMKITEDILAGDTISLALWRKTDKYSQESFSIAASMSTEHEPEVKKVIVLTDSDISPNG